ncbi:glycosyl hydrolase [Burkholderia ubonensis]|nr:glycosyl hydrolase [Burkholderia ubonensis]KVT84492.1 glycosyl hydrolase [Burkholderia ubonensis]
MTPEEQAALLSGRGLWRTGAVPRLGIRSLVMTDGTYGVRYSIDQIDHAADRNIDMDAFLSVVNQRPDATAGAFGRTRPATCFPNGSSVGCAWNVDLMRRMGAALAAECRAFGIDLLLGPGINLRRTPLAGRGYEYYAEDPVVSGDLAAGLIDGLQSGGIGAALKHFACNNSEIERTTMDSIVDERALREVYLRGFQRAIEKSRPWSVMSSYNRLNGVQVAQNRWLLTSVLRDEWGYDGVVMSDWHGIKDRVVALDAGNDLDMPESSTRRAELLDGLLKGEVDTARAREACERMIRLVARASTSNDAGTDTAAEFDAERHHALAQDIAAESLVLLKNDRNVLPLDPRHLRRIAVIGPGAIAPVIQGSGSATTTPTRVDIPLDEIRWLAGPDVQVDFYPGFDHGECSPRDAVLADAALSGVPGADAVIVFAHCPIAADGEGADRRTLNLPHSQEHLIDAVAALGVPVIVVPCVPDAILMPWEQRVSAILMPFLAGQGMGRAVADTLFGRVNPSGKLTVTVPRKVQDIPGYLSYPGENGEHRYVEGIFVGYRHYDAREIEPHYPFGFGLAYTKFELSNLCADRTRFQRGDVVTLSFDVANLGARAGSEVCQLYVSRPHGRLRHAPRELRAFVKVQVAPGETRRVSMTLDVRDLEYFDTATNGWRVDNGEFTVLIGTSSRELPLRMPLVVEGEPARYAPLTLESQPCRILENPFAVAGFTEFFATKMGVSHADAAKLLDHVGGSFFGIFTSMNLMISTTITEAEVLAVLTQANRACCAAAVTERQAFREQHAGVAP